MARLKCSKCGKTFDKEAITDYVAAGITGTRAGIGYTFLVWPFTIRVYATCPVCNEKGWLSSTFLEQRIKMRTNAPSSIESILPQATQEGQQS